MKTPRLQYYPHIPGKNTNILLSAIETASIPDLDPETRQMAEEAMEETALEYRAHINKVATKALIENRY